MNRRGFLAGLLATVAAPALVRGAAPATLALGESTGVWFMSPSCIYLYKPELTEVMCSDILPPRSLNSFIIEEDVAHERP